MFTVSMFKKERRKVVCGVFIGAVTARNGLIESCVEDYKSKNRMRFRMKGYRRTAGRLENGL